MAKTERMPKIGETVSYKTNEKLKAQIKSHGNSMNIDVLPAIITNVILDKKSVVINIKLIIDGTMNNMWIHTVSEGEDDGQFQFLD